MNSKLLIRRLRVSSFIALVAGAGLLPMLVHANEDNLHGYGCISAYGKRKCGYGCAEAYGNIQCGTRPGEKCIAAYGQIGCGYNCEAKLGQIHCESAPPVVLEPTPRNPTIIIQPGAPGPTIIIEPNQRKGHKQRRNRPEIVECAPKKAPIGACDDFVRETVFKPKHMGCTPSGDHVWMCKARDVKPPYPIIVCTSWDSESCIKMSESW